MSAPFPMASLAFEWWRLWFDSAQVIGLRTMRLMHGGARAQHEATRMVAEKWQAAADLAFKEMTGRGGSTPEAATRTAIRHYRSRVSANKRRLSRG